MSKYLSVVVRVILVVFALTEHVFVKVVLPLCRLGLSGEVENGPRANSVLITKTQFCLTQTLTLSLYLDARANLKVGV